MDKHQPSGLGLAAWGAKVTFNCEERCLMRIPAPIYESLPYACAAAGAIAALSVDNLLAWVSGGILNTLGSLIWIARRQHRREADHTASTRCRRASAFSGY
jgi:hypothetical protein